jgi:hypothetical protein
MVMDQSAELPSFQEREPASKTWAIVFFSIAVLVFLAGVISAFRVSHIIDKKNRDVLLTRVQTIAYLVPSQNILKLSGTSADIEKPEYIALKQIMTDLRKVNSDARFVYLMGSNGSKLFFYVDSEKPDSQDYSPPGEVYEDTSSLEFTNYNKGVSFTEGPYKDSWGSWVSAYAPIRDEHNTIVAIVGMDVDATLWKSSLRLAMFSIIGVGVLLALGFLLAGLYLWRSISLLSIFRDTNARLLRDRQSLQGALSRAHFAQWTLIPRTNEFSFDDEMYTLTGIPDGTRVTREVFENSISDEDRPRFRSLLEVAIDHHESEFTHTLSIKLPTGDLRKIKLVVTIRYGSGDVPVLITGTAHDVST